MALSRKMLEGMGLEDKQIESIIESHVETVNGLKAERDRIKEIADRVPILEKEIEESKKASENFGEWHKRFDDLSAEYEDFRQKVATEKENAEKDKSYRAMLLGIGVDPRRVDKIMRITDLSGVTMEDGKIKDLDKYEDSAKEEWADFIVQKKTVGAEPANPPQVSNGIDGADPHVSKMLQERHERLYGKPMKED